MIKRYKSINNTITNISGTNKNLPTAAKIKHPLTNLAMKKGWIVLNTN
jgi:hypothetical protein